LICPNCYEGEMLEEDNTFFCIYCKQKVMKYGEDYITELEDRLTELVDRTIDLVNFDDDKRH